MIKNHWMKTLQWVILLECISYLCFVSASDFLSLRFWFHALRSLSSMTTFCIWATRGEERTWWRQISPTPLLRLNNHFLFQDLIPAIVSFPWGFTIFLILQHTISPPPCHNSFPPLHKPTEQNRTKSITNKIKPIAACPPNQMIPMSAAPSPTWPWPGQKSPTTQACRISSPPSLGLTKRAPTTTQGLAISLKQRIIRRIYRG